MSYRGRFEQPKPKKKRGGKIVLIILAVLLVLVIGAVIAGVVYYNSILGKLDQVVVPKIEYTTAPTEAVETSETTTAVTETTGATTVVTTEPPHIPSSADYINILLVGQASRAGEDERFADTMILCTVNTYEKSLTLTSFLRDSFAKMPDYKGRIGGRIKLTTIYHLGSVYGDGAAGSMELMNQALYDNFGVEVDHNIEVDFDMVIDAIDLLGGVGVELTQAEADYLNEQDAWVSYDVEPGYFWLDGAGALCYARMRKAEGDGDSDIKRTSRQRTLIEALVGRLKKMSLSDVQNLANQILPMITTSMSNQEITDMLLTMLPMLPDLTIVSNGTCPAEGWGDEVDIYSDGMYHSVMRFDAAKEKKLMRAVTEGEIAE